MLIKPANLPTTCPAVAILNTKMSSMSLIVKTITTASAEYKAIKVNCDSRLWSFFYRAVSSFTPSASTSSVFMVELSPTQQTKAFPAPEMTLLPAYKIGSP